MKENIQTSRYVVEVGKLKSKVLQFCIWKFLFRYFKFINDIFNFLKIFAVNLNMLVYFTKKKKVSSALIFFLVTQEQ